MEFISILTSIARNIPDAVSLGILWTLMTLGVYLTFKILNIADLTVDGSFALGGCVTSVFVMNGVNPFFAIFISMIFGMMAGAVTGILHTKLKIPAILAGILTMLSLYSINLMILSGKSNVAMPNLGAQKVTTSFDTMANLTGLSARYANILFGLALVVAIVAILYWFFGTEVGSAIRATGNNEYMVRALGSNTDTMIIIGLVISNGLVAMSGAIVAQSQRYGDIGMGTGTIVIGLASIIIGEVIFGKRASFLVKLISVVGGSIIYRIVISIVLQLGMNSNNLKLLTAVIVAIALSFPVIRGKIADAINAKKNAKAYREVT